MVIAHLLGHEAAAVAVVIDAVDFKVVGHGCGWHYHRQQQKCGFNQAFHFHLYSVVNICRKN